VRAMKPTAPVTKTLRGNRTSRADRAVVPQYYPESPLRKTGADPRNPRGKRTARAGIA